MKRQIELYVREGNENTGDYRRIDLFDFEDINYTTRVADIRQIAKVLTDFTHSFTVPSSKNNNNIFKHYNNFAILDGFDARYKRDAIIKINGVDFRRGQISLNKTNSKKGQLYSYSLTFYGKVVSLKQLFGNDELESLYGVGTCLDDFNHELDGQYVSIGFSGGYNYNEGTTNDLTRNFNDAHCGDYCFPFISADDYHYYDAGDGPSPQSNGNLSRNIHPSATYNASINQFTGVRAFALKPAMKVKWLIKAIEQKYGITFSSDFFNNSNNKSMEDLYLWLNREKGRIDEQVGESTTQFTIDDFTFTGSNPSDVGSFIVNGNQLAPTGSSVNDVRYLMEFTITPDNNDGLWSWSAKDALTNDSYGGSIDNSGTRTVVATFENNGNVMPQIEVRTNGGITGATFSNLSIRKERYEYDGNTGGGFAYMWEPSSSNTFTFNNPTVSFSSGLNIGRNLPKMTINNFLQTLFKMYNLTAYFEYTSDEIVVDTMDNFYATGTTFDISDKIDFEKQETQKALLYNKIDFIYKGDKTFAKQASDAITNDDFGDEKVDHNSTALDSPLAFDGNKDYKVEVPLEKMMFERMTDQNDETVLTDIQWGWMANENQQAIKGEPMFMFLHKVVDGTQIRFSLVDGGSSVLKDDYIIPSALVDINDNTSQSLHFGSEFNEYNGEIINSSLFETYYKKYITDIYNIQTRLIKVSAILDTDLILNLRPNDTLIINHRAFRINKWETNLTTGKSKFELINVVDNTVTNSTDAGGGNNSDETSPYITITSDDFNTGASTELTSTTLTFSLSEYSANFEVGDITVTNGTLSNFTNEGSNQYSAEFTPTVDGACTIQVTSGQFTDVGGNGNNASNVFTFTKTTAAASSPSVTITSSAVSNGGSTSSNSMTLTFMFSASMTGFESADIQTSQGLLKSTFTEVRDSEYTLDISSFFSGIYTVTVPQGVATNGSGVGNTSATFTFTIT